jgi:transposase
MIAVPPGVRVWLAARPVGPLGNAKRYMRKGFDGLAAIVQQELSKDPFGGHLFVFRGKRGDRLKILAWDGQGFCLFAKRLEKGRFVWLSPATVQVRLTSAELAMLIEGIDWRAVRRTDEPAPTRAA